MRAYIIKFISRILFRKPYKQGKVRHELGRVRFGQTENEVCRVSPFASCGVCQKWQ
jgi:hypothetical protein